MLRKCQFHLFLGLLVVGVSPLAHAHQIKIDPLVFSSTDRILVLAPHPDDEVLGAAGVIQEAVAMKLPVRIVFLTNGDSRQWSFIINRKNSSMSSGDMANLGLVRHDEAIDAAHILGVDPKYLAFLGYPDLGMLTIWYYHWNQSSSYRSPSKISSVPYKSAYRFGAAYKGEEVIRDLRSILKNFKPTKIFVSHPADQHGDHAALYLYLRVALWDEGMDGVAVYPYLIHYMPWPKPLGLDPKDDLAPPETLSQDDDWKQYHLSGAQIPLKQQALESNKTQYAFMKHFLLSFVKPNEIFGCALPAQLPMNQNISIISRLKKPMSMREVSNRKKAAFVGINGESLRLEKDDLIVTIRLTKSLPENVIVSLPFFGYSVHTPFGQMPKINIHVDALSYSVDDQHKHLDPPVIQVSRTPKEMTIKLPLKLLGHPQKILMTAGTLLGTVSLYRTSWVIVLLQQ